MREKFQRFMIGRYGTDQFNRFMSIVALIFLIVSIFIRGNILYLLAIVLIGITYFRAFSKNGNKRYEENCLYLKYSAKIRWFFQKQKNYLKQSKEYHIYTCPSCKQKIRIPRGKGKINITCPKCKTEFVKRS